MHPTALMQSLIDILGGEEVRAENPLEAFAQQVLDDLTASGVMVLVVAHRRRTHTPDVAVLALFSPPCFIGLHGRAGANLLLERSEQWFQVCFGPVQQFDDLPATDLEPMQGGEIGLDLSHG